MTLEEANRTSYAGLNLLCTSLVIAVAVSSLLVPISSLTLGEYQGVALLAVLAYSPVLLIVNQTWFRVIVGIFLAIWGYSLLGALYWGGTGLLYLFLPIPLAVSWFLPPAPLNRRTFLTMAGNGALVLLLFTSTLLAISRNEGGVVYLCVDGPIDASILMSEMYQPDPRGGYGLPEGVTSMSSTTGGYAFSFAPFTHPERNSFVSLANQTEWVTEVRVDQACNV